MSCIYLGKGHYQFVADSLYRITVQFRSLMPFRETRQKFGNWDALENEGRICDWVNRLQHWNAQAWIERYPGQEADNGIQAVKQTRPLGGDLNGAQFLKSLECIGYQCSDASEWLNSEYHTDLRMVISEAKDYLIDSLPEYKAAKWAI